MTKGIHDGTSTDHKHIAKLDTARDLVQEPAKCDSVNRPNSIHWLDLQVISSRQIHIT